MTKYLIGLFMCILGVVAWMTRRHFDDDRTRMVQDRLQAIDSTRKYVADSLIGTQRHASDSTNHMTDLLQQDRDDAVRKAQDARARADLLAKERQSRPEPTSATDTAWRTLYADALEENKMLRHALAEQDSAQISAMAMATKFRLDRDAWQNTTLKVQANLDQIQRDCITAVHAASPSLTHKVLTAGTWALVGASAALLLSH